MSAPPTDKNVCRTGTQDACARGSAITDRFLVSRELPGENSAHNAGGASDTAPITGGTERMSTIDYEPKVSSAGAEIEHRPYVPDDADIPEFTIGPVIVGAVLG